MEGWLQRACTVCCKARVRRAAPHSARVITHPPPAPPADARGGAGMQDPCRVRRTVRARAARAACLHRAAARGRAALRGGTCVKLHALYIKGHLHCYKSQGHFTS